MLLPLDGSLIYGRGCGLNRSQEDVGHNLSYSVVKRLLPGVTPRGLCRYTHATPLILRGVFFLALLIHRESRDSYVTVTNAVPWSRNESQLYI